MGKLIHLCDYRYPWTEVLTVDNECSMIQVYTNNQTGEVEFVQMNDDNESIRTVLSAVDAAMLEAVLVNRAKKSAL